MVETLNVSEIFLSIQGEGTRAGRPCVMVRLAGCNLRCHWCDTTYAQSGGRQMSTDDILRDVAKHLCKLVELTGGEPLLQPASLSLLSRLCEGGYEALLETNGSLDIGRVDPRVVRIMDIKCPSSLQSNHNLLANLDYLTARDELKLVIADRQDYEFARGIMREHPRLPCKIIFSPVTSRERPLGAALRVRKRPQPADIQHEQKAIAATGLAALAKWILDDKLNVRLGLQLHKIIWPGIDKGV
jgi:7-carboxy-7-deazaguanine synthase